MRGKVIKLDVLIGRQNVRLIFSPELLQEFYDSANRAKFRRWFTEESIDELIQLINSIGEEVLVTSDIDVCRDPKDNYLLALVKDAEADYLVTGDKDLLILGSFANARIINYRTFAEELDKL